MSVVLIKLVLDLGLWVTGLDSGSRILGYEGIEGMRCLGMWCLGIRGRR